MHREEIEELYYLVKANPYYSKMKATLIELRLFETWTKQSLSENDECKIDLTNMEISLLEAEQNLTAQKIIENIKLAQNKYDADETTYKTEFIKYIMHTYVPETQRVGLPDEETMENPGKFV